MTDARPLIVHLVYRFAVGGLENGIVNLVNRLPAAAWRHMIVALADVDPRFAARVTNADVRLQALDKGPGHAIPLYPRLYELFRRERPAIVHTRNLAALEGVVPAWAARVPARVHGEHGWDAADPGGRNTRRRLIRRLYRPFVSQYVALAPELARYLTGPIGVSAQRVECICNGVDTNRFRPASVRQVIPGCPFAPAGVSLVGTVGRMDRVKDQTNLALAFVRACEREPALRSRLRLVMVGSGPLRGDVDAILRAAGLRELAWLAEERDDVPHVLQGLDCFVLPSLAEGVSNTILEAMATGLPVIATRVGANGDLVVDGESGRLVPAADADALADAIVAVQAEPARAAAMGRAARVRAEQEFSLDRMVDRYHALYTSLLRRRARATGGRGDEHPGPATSA